MTKDKSPIARRFRGFLPVVVDLETGGFDSQKHALLEMAGCPIEMTEDGLVTPGPMVSVHVAPFPGSLLDPKSLEITGIIPDHPLRRAVDEKTALQTFCTPIREAMKSAGCGRAVLVGHNPSFDLGFLNAAINRTGYKRSPFHPFSSFDTATLGGLAFGQTVLARATRAAGICWDASAAHSAIYDVEKTAELFCTVVNQWHKTMGIPWSEEQILETNQPAS